MKIRFLRSLNRLFSMLFWLDLIDWVMRVIHHTHKMVSQLAILIAILMNMPQPLLVICLNGIVERLSCGDYMRYNKRLQFIDDKLVRQPDIYPVNVTSMGIKSQNLVFGSFQQGRIAVRFQNKVNMRSGYMVIDGDNFKIESSTYNDRSSTIYGVEYRGRL